MTVYKEVGRYHLIYVVYHFLIPSVHYNLIYEEIIIHTSNNTYPLIQVQIQQKTSIFHCSHTPTTVVTVIKTTTTVIKTTTTVIKTITTVIKTITTVIKTTTV